MVEIHKENSILYKYRVGKWKYIVLAFRIIMNTFFLILSVLRLDKWQFLKGQLQCGIENLSMNFFTLLL